MSTIQEIHNKVFSILKKEHQKDSNFLFTMRKTNLKNRLEKGYWFLGNESYLSVSFWTGMDWMNKTSNIYFQINKDYSCFFVFSAKDSYFKLKLAQDKILPLFKSKQEPEGVKPHNQGASNILVFSLGQGEYIKILQNFVDNIKPQIDEEIKEFESEYEAKKQFAKEYEDQHGDKYDFSERDDDHSPIGFLDKNDFQECLNRINKYQLPRKLKEIEKNKYYIKKITINNVGDIRNSLTIEIPKETSWVFLTGENGCGKTTILRAITSFFNKEIKQDYTIFNNKSDITFYSHSTNPNDDPIAFAAYGPSRLISTSIDKFLNDKLLEEKTKPWYSIFHPDGILFGFEHLQKLYKNDIKKLQQIIIFLEEMFNEKDKSSVNPNSNDSGGELLPQIAEVNFKEFLTEGKILYREKDNKNVPYPDYHTFEELASGVRSLLALIADLLIKIIERNLDEPDPANFKGVVLIDEIDIHFHPSMQKQIVEILSGSFPKVQFIVSTHSPVTLLGAPENSVFYKVSRNVELGVSVEMLDIDISNLLPNSILSSPIFGFHELFSVTHNPQVKIRTENLFDDIIKNDELRSRLKSIAAKFKDKR